MNNADKPAMPLRGVDGGIFSCRDGYLEQADIASGLTKREHFAATLPNMEVEFGTMDNLAGFLGHAIDKDNILQCIEAGIEAEAKIRVMRADALLAELEKG